MAGDGKPNFPDFKVNFDFIFWKPNRDYSRVYTRIRKARKGGTYWVI
jgi:hypothetical protein